MGNSERECEGQCPKCGSEDINYSSTAEYGCGYLFYTGVCNNCSLRFEENYSVTYTCTSYEG